MTKNNKNMRVRIYIIEFIYSYRKREAGPPPPENLRRRPDEIASKPGSDGFRPSGKDKDDSQPSKSLEKLLREIKNKVKKSKTVWEVLPRQVCNAISKDYSSQLCWNGTSAMKPDKNKTNNDVLDARAFMGKGTP